MPGLTLPSTVRSRPSQPDLPLSRLLRKSWCVWSGPGVHGHEWAAVEPTCEVAAHVQDCTSTSSDTVTSRMSSTGHRCRAGQEILPL